MQRGYTFCAQICVELDVSRALHEGLWLEYRDEDYFQAIDYEKIPFHFRKCHDHGNLIRECPKQNSGRTQGRSGRKEQGYLHLAKSKIESKQEMPNQNKRNTR